VKSNAENARGLRLGRADVPEDDWNAAQTTG